jgi:hypothetical protein
MDAAAVDALANDDGSTGDLGPPPNVPPFAFNGTIYAIVHAGTSWYLGGDFTRYGATPAANELEIDLAGNPIKSCDLGAGFDGPVNASVVVGNSIYVGGAFSKFRGQPASRLAKLDATTCALDTTFSPPANNGFDNPVHALAVDGTSLYVGGEFTAYRGVANSTEYLAKLDLMTGALDTTFSPPGANKNGFDLPVHALAVAGTSLYVGGQFSAYRGVSNSALQLAKLDLTTGALDGAFQSKRLNGTPHALAVAGTSLYAGGSFTTYNTGAVTLNHLAKFDLTSAALDMTFSPA